ncbi:MAG: response regulator [Clostridiaceae bacterium]|nr:response regulator [Clostridiaceae bacterium]
MTEMNNGQTAAQTATEYEYNTLMRLLEVSVSKHLLDEHFTVIWANDFYYQLIGWTREEYEERFHNQCDLYYADDKEEWERLVSVVMQAIENHQNGYNLITTLRRKDGEHIWVKFSTSFSDEFVDGCQVAYTIITNIDDFVRMQREQSITYDNLPGFVAKFRIEEEGFHILEANNRFRDFFDCQELNWKPTGLSNLDTEKNRAVYEQNFPMMRRGESVHFSLQAKDRMGGNSWLQVNADCIGWTNGNPVYLVIYIDITDITEQKELQKELEERSEMLHKALKEAEHANRAKSDFLSRMSHDIRTPMNAIMGMTTIAANNLDNPERVSDCLNKITVSSKLLLSLINEVLDMSKIESGRMVIAEEEVNLTDLIQGIISMVQPQIAAKNLQFNVHLNDILNERVISDMQRLQQLLLNLLSNAVKYTAKGGSVLFEINQYPSEVQDKSFYEFVVSDTGIGMKTDFLERIFLPFERADDEQIQMIQGTGLGLSICKKITETMGGTIRAESEYGSGSRFTARVCLRTLEESIDESVLMGMSVLVVDDDEIICQNICKRLESIGVKAEWVSKGAEAVERIRKAHESGRDYFAAIIDYKMPGMDGIETTRRIRREVGDALPVIMISAYDLSEHMDAAARAGANGFITKPLFCSRLVYKLKQLVENRDRGEMSVQPARTLTFEGKRILLAEDNKLNQEIVVELLSYMGITVETADDGKIALDKMMQAPEGYYDLIFMDMQMPQMDGCTAAKLIRDLDREDVKRIPIIAMTANAFGDDRQKTADAGMNEHLAKPIDMDQLNTVLQKWL